MAEQLRVIIFFVTDRKIGVDQVRSILYNHGLSFKYSAAAINI